MWCEGSPVCQYCGRRTFGKFRTACKHRPRSLPYATAINDTIIRDGEPVQVRTLRPPCVYLGPKRFHRDGSPKMAKAQGCKNTPENRRPVIFTPVYECAVYRRAAPFAQSIEDDFPPHPCYGCKEYQPCPPTTE